MINNDYQLFKKYLQRDWSIQGFSAVPIFLSTAAMSGTYMKKYLGFGYRHFLFNYHKGYGEMAYDPEDFKNIWLIVNEKIAINSSYLKDVKKLYHQNLNQYKPFFQKIKQTDLAKLNEQEIIKLFQELILAQLENVGVSHVIDAIGSELEKEFQKALRGELPEISVSKFNEIFSGLITPSKISFVNQEEEDLLKIKGGTKNKKALEKHLAKYFWIQNSYAGPKLLTVDDFSKKLISLKKEKKRNKNNFHDYLPYHFSKKLKRMIKIIDYCAVWQDERKALLFKNISFAGWILQEISRRLNQNVEILYYLSLMEVKRLKSLRELAKKTVVLKERQSGCLMIIQGERDKFISGASYRRLMKENRSLVKSNIQNTQELHGTVANTGVARGRVRIIKNMLSLNKFQAGDILVASMTRPEYMSAIKKAAAIITNEGGITCHAAIIARELNIPTIIGTKNATQILRDGDLIEVNANHGVIRIIK